MRAGMHAYLFFKDRWGAVFPRPLVSPKWRSYDLPPTCYPLPHYLVPHAHWFALRVCVSAHWLSSLGAVFQLCLLCCYQTS